jgi:hypothetical protein
MANWARSIGPNTAQLFERILNAKPHPKWVTALVSASFAWRSSTLRNAMEAAAERALLAKACRYREVDLKELAGHGSPISSTTTRLPASDP